MRTTDSESEITQGQVDPRLFLRYPGTGALPDIAPVHGRGHSTIEDRVPADQYRLGRRNAYLPNEGVIVRLGSARQVDRPDVQDRARGIEPQIESARNNRSELFGLRIERNDQRHDVGAGVLAAVCEHRSVRHRCKGCQEQQCDITSPFNVFTSLIFLIVFPSSSTRKISFS